MITYEEALKITENSEAFFVKRGIIQGHEYAMFSYRLATYEDFKDNEAYELRGLTFIRNCDEWYRHLALNKFFNLNENSGTQYEDFKDKIKDRKIIIGGENFGCGSSREHAPQALKDYGIQALIGESFAEIFAGNCSTLGIPAVTLAPADTNALQTLIEGSPETEIAIDLETMIVSAGKKRWKASMPESYRNALLDGSWDSTAVLAAGASDIDKIAAELPYV